MQLFKFIIVAISTLANAVLAEYQLVFTSDILVIYHDAYCSDFVEYVELKMTTNVSPFSQAKARSL